MQEADIDPAMLYGCLFSLYTAPLFEQDQLQSSYKALLRLSLYATPFFKQEQLQSPYKTSRRKVVKWIIDLFFLEVNTLMKHEGLSKRMVQQSKKWEQQNTDRSKTVGNWLTSSDSVLSTLEINPDTLEKNISGCGCWSFWSWSHGYCNGGTD